MSYLFPPSKPLLYPQFETYKLHSLNPDDNLLVYKLPEPGTTQSRASNSSSNYLSFKEVRNRISWDHLSTDPQGNRGVYVDGDWNVVGFVVDDNLRPTFSKLASLPIPISSTEQQSEFPSVLPITSNRWAVSSGSGSLYILETTSSASAFEGKFIAKYDLPPSSGCSSSSSVSTDQPSPFLLRSTHQISDTEIKILLTRSIISKDEKTGKKNFTSAQLTKFELIEITINPTLSNNLDESESSEEMQVNWRLVGGDLPVYCSWSNGGWIILSPEQYHLPTDQQNEDGEESEFARNIRERNEKISKLGLGASLPSSDATEAGSSNQSKGKEVEDQNVKMDIEEQEEEEDKVYPYSWTQDSESINMIIPLPRGIHRQHVTLNLTSTEFIFSSSTSTNSSTKLSAELEKFLSKERRTFWTNIDPELSTWSFDSSKDQIEIDLSKVDQNVRWPSIFSSPDNDDADADEEEEVPETLSSEILASVRESFNSIKTRDPPGEGEPNITHHPAMPALLREEMDFDLDDDEDFGDSHDTGAYDELSGGTGGGGKVGKEVYIGHIHNSTGVSSWSKTTTSVLSLPISNNDNEEEGVIIKSAVDGLLFEPPKSNLTKQAWKHISTNPALAFVLSSKRDLRLIKHLTTTTKKHDAEIHPHENAEPTSPSSAKRLKPSSSAEGVEVQSTVLAFDSGNSLGQGNLYIYYPPSKNDKLYAKQGVIPVSGGDKGALLGVGSITVKGKQVVVVLTEKSLVILKDIV